MKIELNNLALFGGEPMFGRVLHVGRPHIGDKSRFISRIEGMLDRKWLTNDGPLVKEFEREVARRIGVKHCLATSNGTLALELAARAAGLTGEVIVPAFTFVATAHSLRWHNITPVFCDVDPHTHNLNPSAVERLITPRTTGILGVHLWGRSCDVEALTEIAKRRHLRLLFDAAHAFGCSNRGVPIGGAGDAEVFSFHATKCVNAMEGGAIVTNDDEIASRVALMRQFGFVRYDNVISVGTNAKMCEAAAAMGLTSLESMHEFIALNRRRYRQYREELSGISGVQVAIYDETEECNFHYVVLEIDEAVTTVNRDQIHQVLWAENVLARRYFFPGCHRMEPYNSECAPSRKILPVTEALANRILVLPTGAALDEGEVHQLCQLLRFVVTRGREIVARLSGQAQNAEKSRAA